MVVGEVCGKVKNCGSLSVLCRSFRVALRLESFRLSLRSDISSRLGGLGITSLITPCPL